MAAKVHGHGKAYRSWLLQALSREFRDRPHLEPVDLDGAVVTSDALHTVRANLDWLNLTSFTPSSLADCWCSARRI